MFNLDKLFTLEKDFATVMVVISSQRPTVHYTARYVSSNEEEAHFRGANACREYI